VEPVAAVFRQPLPVAVELPRHCVVVALLFIVLALDVCKLIPQRAQPLDLRRQSLLLLLDFGVDPLN
jgi:hypothetical protein